MKKYPESVCKCDLCVGLCLDRPCWPTPEEAEALIEKGFANKLMLDWWVGGGPNDDNIEIISPAIIGSEGDRAPSCPKGGCTFLTEQNLCELHSLKLKPVEGRVATCKDEFPGIHEDTAMSWNNKKGRGVVLKWRKICFPEDFEENENFVQHGKGVSLKR
jgi:hypothetical protein